MKKQEIIQKLKDLLVTAYKFSISGKTLYTRYDFINALSKNQQEYEKIDNLIRNDSKINAQLNNWLNNNFWHVAIAAKIPKGIELYIETELKLKYKKHVPNFENDIPTPKVKVSKFTMNNEIDGVPNFINENDEIMNLGKPEDFEDWDIPLEEEMEAQHDE